MKCILLRCLIGILGTCILSLVFFVPAEACTAFSVKTDTNVYCGKNWDYNITDSDRITFSLEQIESDLWGLAFRYNGYLSSAINSDGFFVPANDVYNIMPGDCADDPEAIDITSLRML